jgi:ABC-type Fe3+/spermidine/putrescine transport system ATPase subunit
MVFQSYALFPHLSVERNIAFGLEMRAPRSSEIPGRVRKAMGMVRMDVDKFARRIPAQLSGGQRQRVALARALVLEPPSCCSTSRSARSTSSCARRCSSSSSTLNRELGTTFIYVTHDQEEALTMSDRIAVMSEARVAQLGSPAEIYECPRTPFVAKFIGESNFFEGVQPGPHGGRVALDGPQGAFRVPDHPSARRRSSRSIAVRPEWLDVCRPDAVPAGRERARRHDPRRHLPG